MPRESFLRYPISHYDRYEHPAVQKPRCRSCGASDTAAVIAGMPLCAECATSAMRLVDVSKPYDQFNPKEGSCVTEA